MSARAVADDDRPAVGHGFRLQWEAAQNAYVLLYPEGLVRLNSSAAEILKRCDGKATVAAITVDLEGAFSATGLAADVRDFLAFALERRWVEIGA